MWVRVPPSPSVVPMKATKVIRTNDTVKIYDGNTVLKTLYGKEIDCRCDHVRKSETVYYTPEYGDLWIHENNDKLVVTNEIQDNAIEAGRIVKSTMTGITAYKRQHSGEKVGVWYRKDIVPNDSVNVSNTTYFTATGGEISVRVEGDVVIIEG